MKTRLVIAAVMAVAAAIAAPATAGAQVTSRAPRLSGPTITNFGVAQTTAVNAAMTSFPFQVHWTNGSAVTTQKLYRYDEATNVETLLTTITGTAGSHQQVDTLPVPAASGVGDAVHYVVASFVGQKFFGNTSSYSFDPETADDAAATGFLRVGTWTQKTLSGATKGHYRVSSSTGAQFRDLTCYLNFGLIVTTSPQGGKANLYVNGTFMKVLNFKSTKTIPRVLIWKSDVSTQACNAIEMDRISGQINFDGIQETGVPQ